MTKEDFMKESVQRVLSLDGEALDRFILHLPPDRIDYVLEQIKGYGERYGMVEETGVFLQRVQERLS